MRLSQKGYRLYVFLLYALILLPILSIIKLNRILIWPILREIWKTKFYRYRKNTQQSSLLVPRQVGKTTVLRQLMKQDREYVTLDDLEERSIARNDPALFLQIHSHPIMIDEVQYAPQLFSYIKIEIDNGAALGSF